MSTPLLTPVETPIFDDLVISDLEEHFDDDVPCERSEDHGADVLMKCRRCEHGILLCTDHLVKQRAKLEAVLAMGDVRGLECAGCGLRSHSFDEAIVVVPL